MIRMLAFVLLVSLGSACSPNNKTKVNLNKVIEKSSTSAKLEVKDKFSIITIFSSEFGWGYQILNNGSMFINQPHIPSVQGNKGFESKEKAIVTGEYIIHKLENDIFPPTITPQELDSLKVL